MTDAAASTPASPTPTSGRDRWARLLNPAPTDEIATRRAGRPARAGPAATTAPRWWRRVAQVNGPQSFEDAQKVITYTSSVRLFASTAQAAAHGLTDLLTCRQERLTTRPLHNRMTHTQTLRRKDPAGQATSRTGGVPSTDTMPIKERP